MFTTGIMIVPKGPLSDVIGAAQAAEEALDALDVRDGLQLHVAPRALGVSVPVSLRT